MLASTASCRRGRPRGSITSYVLREQGDWFEDEIKFVRRIVAPGEGVIVQHQKADSSEPFRAPG